jgi:hydroxyacylglutathione hydrolase
LDKKITLIDSGVKGCEKQICDFVRSSGRSIGDIETIILSHSHPDHIGSAAQIKKDTQCEVVAHELERNWIEDIEIQNQQRPIPGFFMLVDEPVMFDCTIDDNEMLSIGRNLDLRIIHTPGHSPGHLSMLFLGKNILFTGDALPLPGDIPNYDNYHQLIHSIRRIKKMKNYNNIISSWAEPLVNCEQISEFTNSGLDYIERIDNSVRKLYNGQETDKIHFCKAVIEDLNLPAVYVNPLVNKAFLSHL